MDNDSKNSVIRLFNVSKKFGDKFALKDISLEIEQGEFVFISGPSGAGKSTLLKILYLAEKVSDGQILINGINLARISLSKLPLLRRKFGMVFQDFKLIPTKTVYENVALVLEAAGEKPSFIRAKVEKVLESVGMEKKQKILPPTLSGGEKQKVAIARAVVGEPSIILADEPTGSLDPVSAEVILELLMEYQKKGTTILVASHNQYHIESNVRCRNIEINDGMIHRTATML